MKPLTVAGLKTSASVFAREMNATSISYLFGITDGKAVGTFVEHAFHEYLRERFSYSVGSSASGIDFPALEVDLKVTSIRQPQSSCPFREAAQKVYGLGYHLLVFVYDKQDDDISKTAHLDFRHVVFVRKERTADFQTTRGILQILERDGNIDDIIAFLEERNLPLDEVGRVSLAEQIMKRPPAQGYLTVSNALQWRLQYSRVVVLAEEGLTEGVENLLRE